MIIKFSNILLLTYQTFTDTFYENMTKIIPNPLSVKEGSKDRNLAQTEKEREK